MLCVCWLFSFIYKLRRLFSKKQVCTVVGTVKPSVFCLVYVDLYTQAVGINNADGEMNVYGPSYRRAKAEELAVIKVWKV